MVIREYVNSDFNDVINILIKTFPSVSESMVNREINNKLLELDRDKYFQIVAEVDNKIVGYLLATKKVDPILSRNNFWIDYFCVDENYRGRGIGNELLNKIEIIAKEEKIFYLELTSSRFRVSARNLYLNFGFEIRESDIFRKELG